MARILVYIYLFTLALVLSLALVPLMARLARRNGLMDFPSERKSHAEPRPLLGGLGIYLSFVAVVGGNLVALLLLYRQPWAVEQFSLLVRQVPLLPFAAPRLTGVLLGGTAVLVVGLLDDRQKNGSFSPALKLAAQLAAAGFAVGLGVHTTVFPGEILDYAVSILWLVGITNAFNFLDNMDGLSAGVGLLAGLLFGFLAARQGQFFSAMVFAAFAGSVLGFLRYNFYPARIFMGDAGSLFIGFTLASLAITTSYVVQGSPGYMPVLIPVLVLSLPLVDTASVVYLRIRERRPVYVADRRHISHRLVDLGLSQRQAVFFLYLLTFDVGLSAILLPYVPVWGAWIILLQAVALYGMISFLMGIGSQGAGQRVSSLAGVASTPRKRAGETLSESK